MDRGFPILANHHSSLGRLKEIRRGGPPVTHLWFSLAAAAADLLCRD
jgi:hypothetical protein